MNLLFLMALLLQILLAQFLALSLPTARGHHGDRAGESKLLLDLLNVSPTSRQTSHDLNNDSNYTLLLCGTLKHLEQETTIKINKEIKR
jgi:hypothetical protein